MRLMVNKAILKVSACYFGIYLLHYLVLKIAALHYSIYFLYPTFVFIAAILFIIIAIKVYHEEATNFAKHKSLAQFLSNGYYTIFCNLPLQIYAMIVAKVKRKE